MLYSWTFILRVYNEKNTAFSNGVMIGFADLILCGMYD